MTGPPLTALPETPVGEIARLLTEHRISGVPIVNEQGELVGMVTESDLFLKEKGVPFSLVRVPALFNQWADPKRIIEVYEHARQYTAADVMTRNVFSVDVEEQIGEVARLMLRHKVKRLPVLENGKLVGIITRQDLLCSWLSRRKREGAPLNSVKTCRGRTAGGPDGVAWAGVEVDCRSVRMIAA